MNKARMLELADAIEAAPRHQFDMESFVGKYTVDKAGRRRRGDEVFGYDDIMAELRPKELSCGTSACIAGWAIHLHPRAGLDAAWKPTSYRGEKYYDTESHARAILGLTLDESQILFYERMNQTNVQAAALLRCCVELGTVPEPHRNGA